MSPSEQHSSLRLRLSVVRLTATEEATAELIRRLARLIDPSAAMMEACAALRDRVATGDVHYADVGLVLLAVAGEGVKPPRKVEASDVEKVAEDVRATVLLAAPTDEHEN